MTELTKIDFHHRKVRDIADVTDLVAVLFPRNRNQQRAAARILLALRQADTLLPTLSHLERDHHLSRRTLQRARAKLARLGLIEHVSPFNTRHHGYTGWKLSTRFAAGLRHLADHCDHWQHPQNPRANEKEQVLVDLL